MSEFNSLTHMTAALLLTYSIHSTLIGLLTCVILRYWRFAKPDLRVLLWKLALTLPLVTCLVTSFSVVPQWGFALNITPPTETKQETIVPHVTSISESSEIQEIDVEPAMTPLAIPQTSQRQFVEEPTTISESSNIGLNSSSSLEPLKENDFSTTQFMTHFVVLVWFVVAFAAVAYLIVHYFRLRVLCIESSPVAEDSVLDLVSDLSKKAGVRFRVSVVTSNRVRGPLTGGILKPFIVVPQTVLELLNYEERQGMIAHEVIHIARRDNLWKLIGHVVCGVFFVQPLNRYIRYRLEVDTEFVVDHQAAQLLEYREGLAGCLCRIGEWLANPSTTPATYHRLATGMATFQSTLGQRVETLLSENPESQQTRHSLRRLVGVVAVASSVIAISLSPRFVANSRIHSTPNDNAATPERNQPMKKQLLALALVTSLSMPALADENETAKTEHSPITKTTPDEFPPGIKRFNGMLVGRLVKKDIETGTFLVNVDAVPKVWRNSRAENPKSIVGKNVQIDGVSGKWLDVLLVVKNGETLEFEARHDGGDKLTFPGELLRKVAAFDPKDYPVLPEKFRGFQGSATAKITKKDPETFELIVEVQRINEASKNSRAKDAKSIEGKQMMLAGFWNRKDQYHNLKVGDVVTFGMRHIEMRSDHLTVAEVVRKAEERRAESPSSVRETERTEFPAGIKGFRGAVVGKLVSKDVEKGTLQLTVDAVPRIWQKSKARKPKSMVGKNVTINGVSNRFLDVLLTTKTGETLEVAGFHDEGSTLTFPGELFRKVAPYKAENYPTIPDGFRGFQGMISAEVVKKDSEMYSLIIKVNKVERSFDKSQAKSPESVEGKNVILAGFWRKKDFYGDLKVGDTIEAGVRNETTGTDVVSVIEGVRKVSKEGERR